MFVFDNWHFRWCGTAELYLRLVYVYVQSTVRGVIPVTNYLSIIKDKGVTDALPLTMLGLGGTLKAQATIYLFLSLLLTIWTPLLRPRPGPLRKVVVDGADRVSSELEASSSSVVSLLWSSPLLSPL